MKSNITIRKAIESDKPELYNHFMAVCIAGEAFMHDESTTYEEWDKFWFGTGVQSYTALEGDAIVGSYKLSANHPGKGNHIANGGYMVAPDQRGKRIGELLGQHSIIEAEKLGFKALQFNAVVSSNSTAVKLWQKLGFEIVGEVPNAFRRLNSNPSSIYIMHRAL